MIKPMDYCLVVNDKTMKGSGLFRGDAVLVTGLKVAPVSKKDPYLQRIYAHVIKVAQDGHHFVPSEDNDNMIYLVDPRNLEKLPEDDQTFLGGKLVAQYNG